MVASVPLWVPDKRAHIRCKAWCEGSHYSECCQYQAVCDHASKRNRRRFPEHGDFTNRDRAALGYEQIGEPWGQQEHENKEADEGIGQVWLLLILASGGFRLRMGPNRRGK
ncbi:MAG: hypothetical protein JWP40_3922 [Blastococcus sp.]|nr:hypothetical protein [Blastococcus sp.]